MMFRLDPDLHRAGVTTCKDDRSAAQVLRAFMRDYVERNGLGSLPLAGVTNLKGKS